MAKKTTRKTAYKKKRTYKSKRKPAVRVSNSSRVGIENQLSNKTPLPERYKAKFRYSQTVQVMTGTAGVTGTSQRFSLSSMYDPDFTGLGHQPYGFDQFDAFYGKYKVDKAKVTLIWSTVGASSDVACISAIQPSNVASNISNTNLDTLIEKQICNSIYLSPSGNNRVVEQTFTVDLRKIFGVKSGQYDDEAYEAAFNASPTNQVYLDVNVASPSGAGSVSTTCSVLIEYMSTLFNRKALPAS